MASKTHDLLSIFLFLLLRIAHFLRFTLFLDLSSFTDPLPNIQRFSICINLLPSSLHIWEHPKSSSLIFLSSSHTHLLSLDEDVERHLDVVATGRSFADS